MFALKISYKALSADDFLALQVFCYLSFRLNLQTLKIAEDPALNDVS